MTSAQSLGADGVTSTGDTGKCTSALTVGQAKVSRDGSSRPAPQGARCELCVFWSPRHRGVDGTARCRLWDALTEWDTWCSRWAPVDVGPDPAPAVDRAQLSLFGGAL